MREQVSKRQFRVDGFAEWYASIARYHDSRLDPLSERLSLFRAAADSAVDEAHQREFDDRKLHTFRLMFEASCIALVFSGMALEAHIYDYAAEAISDGFVHRHLDRLDLVSKWVVIPEIVTGQPFPREGRPFQLLQRLVKRRNALVHSKSKAMPLPPRDPALGPEPEIAVPGPYIAVQSLIPAENVAALYESMGSNPSEFCGDDSLVAIGHEAVEALDLLAAALDSMDPHGLNATPRFSQDFFRGRDIDFPEDTGCPKTT